MSFGEQRRGDDLDGAKQDLSTTPTLPGIFGSAQDAHESACGPVSSGYSSKIHGPFGIDVRHYAILNLYQAVKVAVHVKINLSGSG
jgi:hypothetical protein